MAQCKQSVFVGAHQFFCVYDQGHINKPHHPAVGWSTLKELAEQHVTIKAELAEAIEIMKYYEATEAPGGWAAEFLAKHKHEDN